MTPSTNQNLTCQHIPKPINSWFTGLANRSRTHYLSVLPRNRGFTKHSLKRGFTHRLKHDINIQTRIRQWYCNLLQSHRALQKSMAPSTVHSSSKSKSHLAQLLPVLGMHGHGHLQGPLAHGEEGRARPLPRDLKGSVSTGRFRRSKRHHSPPHTTS